ncbi:sensor histidine kinase [Priestia filamentosa]|uniref:sensor histidine kinase n=1 Tax=Priestia filamentosa TaxID=1402861 RepID=UPI0005895AAB|nr:sensor histidine kinase [Priestia filamentosa]RJS64342.1 hypothetical protein CJ485_06165 [Priestia filamentosa]WCM17464.1 sensor histidine kinase [Priestia filamentosa]
MNTLSCLEDLHHLSLSQKERIMEVAHTLQLTADIAKSDMFIDCSLSEDKAMIVAQAQPATASSLYKRNIIGETATEQNEPGVFFSLRTGNTITNSRGITQECVIVQQDIVPIVDNKGTTIGVLIRERDISEEMMTNKRVEELLIPKESADREGTVKSLIQKEIHHRVKNNLQVISSLLRLQTRRAHSEVSDILQDSVARIETISIIHDYLAQDGIEAVNIVLVMERAADMLIRLASVPEKEIALSVEGEPTFLPSNQATFVLLIVNELVQNCLKHAFEQQKSGKISITVICRKQIANITVEDNGRGIIEDKRSSLGLQLVHTLAAELNGVLSTFSSEDGTKMTLTFPIAKAVML